MACWKELLAVTPLAEPVKSPGRGVPMDTPQLLDEEPPEGREDDPEEELEEEPDYPPPVTALMAPEMTLPTVLPMMLPKIPIECLLSYQALSPP